MVFGNHDSFAGTRRHPDTCGLAPRRFAGFILRERDQRRSLPAATTTGKKRVLVPVGYEQTPTAWGKQADPPGDLGVWSPLRPYEPSTPPSAGTTR